MQATSVRSLTFRGSMVAAVLGLAGASAARAQETPPVGRAEPAPRDTPTLSLSEARRLALRQNPAFLAERQEAEIAGGELRQARSYRYNPEVEFEAPGSVSAGGVDSYEAAVFQELEWAGQWGLRADAAEIGLDRAEHSVRDAARATLADVSAAFYAALVSARRLDVAEEVLGLHRELLDAVRIQVREGEISVLEANLAEIERGRAQARVLAARREQTSALLALKRLTGLASDLPIRLDAEVPAPPPPATLDEDALVRLALSRRPDLAAQAAAERQFEALGRLARREAIPNVRIGVFADRDRASGEPSYGLGVSLPIPLWNRNQGLVAQREAQAEQAALGVQAVELRIRTEVGDAYRAYIAASEEVEIYQRDVLDPARENQRLLETAYRAGKIDLPALLLLRNQLLDAELGYWDAWLARRAALVAIGAATASLGDTENDARRDDDDPR